MNSELHIIQEQKTVLKRQNDLIEELMEKNEMLMRALEHIVKLTQEKNSCVDICSCDDVWVEATNALRKGA